jgi:uncharacterized cupredoxin-like copper-binding protein
MAVYYVLGIALVVFALVLFAIGQTREGFPPSVNAGRALMAVAGVLVVATFAVLVAETEKEHPREHAKAEEAKKEAEGGGPGGAQPAGGALAVSENEYSIELTGGDTLEPGKHRFDVVNEGKIEHDLAVEGAGTEEKTPLIAAGKEAKLAVELEPGTYKLYCTVPGHEELGMKTEVTVR